MNTFPQGKDVVLEVSKSSTKVSRPSSSAFSRVSKTEMIKEMEERLQAAFDKIEELKGVNTLLHEDSM